MRLLRFRRWLYDMFTDWKPDFVVYEQAHHRGGAATEVCVGMTGVLQMVCSEKGVQYGNVKTSVLKKFATGKGNAGKPQMIDAANGLGHPFPDQVESDDQADAIHIFRWGVETFAS